MKMIKTTFLSLLILFVYFVLFESCQKEKLPTLHTDKIIVESNIDTTIFEIDFKASYRKVKENRVADFIRLLQNKGVNINNPKELLSLTVSFEDRKQMAKTYDIDFLCLQVHIELASLLAIGLSEIDAQMLHFSHWNYQNPFIGEIMNVDILAHTNPESILMDMAGWAAGNSNPIVQKYEVGILEIEEWIGIANSILQSQN